MGLFNKNRYGSHQRVHILPFTVDRTNLFTGKVEYHVDDEDFDKPNAQFLGLGFGSGTIAQLAGISNLASGGRRAAPLCVGVERRYDDAASMAIYTYTFEGIATNASQRYI